MFFLYKRLPIAIIVPNDCFFVSIKAKGATQPPQLICYLIPVRPVGIRKHFLYRIVSGANLMAPLHSLAHIHVLSFKCP